MPNLAGRLWLCVAVAIAAILFTVATYRAGYNAASDHFEARQARAVAQVEQAWREQYQQSLKINDQLQIDLARQATRIEYVIQEVPVYVTPEKDRDCDPSVGVVGLLNAARSDSMPPPAGGSSEASGTPSGLGFGHLLRSDIDTIFRYNQLMKRHNALLLWIEENYGQGADYGN